MYICIYTMYLCRQVTRHPCTTAYTPPPRFAGEYKTPVPHPDAFDHREVGEEWQLEETVYPH